MKRFLVIGALAAVVALVGMIGYRELPSSRAQRQQVELCDRLPKEKQRTVFLVTKAMCLLGGWENVGSLQPTPGLLDFQRVDAHYNLPEGTAEAVYRQGEETGTSHLTLAQRLRLGRLHHGGLWTLGDIEEALAKKDNTDEVLANTYSETEAANRLVRELEKAPYDYPAWRSAVDGLVELGDHAVPTLIKALDDGDDCVRGFAALTLGEIRDNRTTGHLAKHLNDKAVIVARGTPECVGGMCADALVKIGDRSVVPQLRAALLAARREGDRRTKAEKLDIYAADSEAGADRLLVKSLEKAVAKLEQRAGW